MDIVLQGKDFDQITRNQFFFNPLDGKKVSLPKARKHITADGQIVLQVGDVNDIPKGETA